MEIWVKLNYFGVVLVDYYLNAAVLSQFGLYNATSLLIDIDDNLNWFQGQYEAENSWDLVHCENLSVSLSYFYLVVRAASSQDSQKSTKLQTVKIFSSVAG